MAKPSKKKSDKKTLSSHFAPWLWRAISLAFIWGGIALCALMLFYAIDLPSIDKPKDIGRKPSLTVLARDGSEIIRTGQAIGKFYTLKDLPKHVPQAVLAIEDRRFYYHFGIDPLGIARAMIMNLISRDVVQGGSTITQQLAKNMFLSSEQTFKRKVQEAMLAINLEIRFSKDEILEAYLNRVYMGSGNYGIGAAARRYFHKSASELSLREAAMIAGLLRAPNYFSPIASPARADDRTKTVLESMADAGYITEKQAKAAQLIPPTPGRRPGSDDSAYYAADYVASEAAKVLGEITTDLVVQTTLDARSQRAAELAVDEIMPHANEKNVSQVALVSIGNDGGVRALIGGANYHESTYNRAFQARRQPGSSFKPIVYLAALEGGFTPATMVMDQPIEFGSWKPQNFDGEYFGEVTLAFALAKSLNAVAVHLIETTGVSNVIDVAHRLGIQSKLDANYSLALGTTAIPPIELATAYNTLAQGGQYRPTHVIQSIKDKSGRTLFTYTPPAARQVVAPQFVSALTAMMTGVTSFGTGTAANIGRPQAGKTGTSQDYRDAWFAGFVPQMATVVWMGNDNNEKMQRVTGGSFPARLWASYMNRALAGQPALPLTYSHIEFDNTPRENDFMDYIIRWNAPREAEEPKTQITPNMEADTTPETAAAPTEAPAGETNNAPDTQDEIEPKSDFDAIISGTAAEKE